VSDERCNVCLGPLMRKPSEDFDGYDLVVCADCGRPVTIVKAEGE
jgi:hypothetical protein